MLLNIIRSILFTTQVPGLRPTAALWVLRTFIGVAFVFHGYGKAEDLDGFAKEFGMPMAVAAAAAYAQMIAGGLLIIGLVTPIAALTIVSTMTVATLKLIGRGEPFISPHGHSFEASAFYLISSLVIALLGPGGWSLDALLLRMTTRWIDGAPVSARSAA